MTLHKHTHTRPPDLPPIPSEVSPVTAADEAIVRNLLQLYLYDLTEFEPRDVDARGAFPYHYLESYWVEPDRLALVLRCAGRPAGFALVNEESVLDPNARGVRTIAEFFVIRSLRRLGLGKSLALETFRRRPGRWEVRQMGANAPAIAFWRRVIGDYTGGRFVEMELDDRRWRGPVQTFDNSLMVG